MPVKPRGSSWQVTVGSGADRFRATAPTEEAGLLIEKQEILRRQQKALGLLVEKRVEAVPKVDVTLRRLHNMALRGKWLNDSGVQAKNANLIIEDLGERTAATDIDRQFLQEYVEKLYAKGNTGATINRKLSALNVLLKIAETEGWIEQAPKIPRQREEDVQMHYFTTEEEEEMLSICEKLGMDDLADFIIFAIDTGFRRMEILNLKLRDCQDGQAVLHAGTTKSGKGRAVPLTPEAQAVVDKRKERGYTKLFEDMTDAQLRKRWEILKNSMSDPGEHFIVHGLRHTCASRLAQAGCNASAIQQWMGHSTILVSQKYIKMSGATLKETSKALSSFRKKPAVKKAGHLKQVA